MLLYRIVVSVRLQIVRHATLPVRLNADVRVIVAGQNQDDREYGDGTYYHTRNHL